MQRHARSGRPTLITSASKGPDDELDRRRKRYATMAAICIASFTASGLVYRETVLAVLLCGIAMITLPAAVITANVRSRPRSPRRVDHLIRGPHQLPGQPARQPEDDR